MCIRDSYYRDNMKLLLHVISEYGKETVIAALRTCLEKNIYNSLSVQEISGSIHRSKDNMDGMTIQAPTSIPETADCHPEKTDINLSLIHIWLAKRPAILPVRTSRSMCRFRSRKMRENGRQT